MHEDHLRDGLVAEHGAEEHAQRALAAPNLLCPRSRRLAIDLANLERPVTLPSPAPPQAVDIAAIPPLEAPSIHLRPICVSLVIVVSSCKFLGGSGTNTMFAPLPGSENSDAPWAFFDKTLA